MRLILWEVGKNCQGSLTVLRAVSQYSWGLSVQTLNYWPELLRATISQHSRGEGEWGGRRRNSLIMNHMICDVSVSGLASTVVCSDDLMRNGLSQHRTD